jgi:hypothetical protein
MRTLEIVGPQRGIFVPTRESVTEGEENFRMKAIKFVFLKNIYRYRVKKYDGRDI